MYAITGITGQVGGQVAEALLAAGEPVRAVVRSAARGAVWTERGCEVAVVADATDAGALGAALAGVRGAFLMNPPNYDPEPGFADTRRVVAAFAQAIAVGQPGRVIALSSVGAQVARFNLLNNAGLLEAGLAGADVPVAMLRPAWFLENARWDVMAARAGRIESYLTPLGRGIEMVSVRDIGQVAAGLLREEWRGRRVVELRGPEPVSPQALASTFEHALDRPVAVAAVPRGDWEARFRTQGMQHPQARMAMLDGFNEGWIGFEGAPTDYVTGIVGVEKVVADLLARG